MTIGVNVLMGGPSAEHDVSLRSGLQVLSALDRNVYRPRAVVISEEKQFYFCDYGSDPLEFSDVKDPGKCSRLSGPFSPAASAPVWEGCDVAYLALHGSFGEDGVIQGFMEAIGIPYTGSGVFGSAVAMEKIASKFLYINGGLSVPPWSIYGADFPEVTVDSIERSHGFPCFIKAPQSGSSRLMGRADDRAKLAELIAEFSREADRLLIETAITGIEFSCGVIEAADGVLTALPPIEIRPKGTTFFDYETKYTNGKSDELCPAPQPEELLDRVKKTALAAHRILGCSGVSRTDMIYASDTLFVLETNTLPGMTATSLLPKEFMAAGGTYAGLVDVLIRAALRKRAAPSA